MKRSPSISFIALILGLLALAGFALSLSVFTNVIALKSYMGILIFVNALAATSAAVGLWKLRPWAHLAVRIWMLVCVVILLTFSIHLSIHSDEHFILGGQYGLIGFATIIGLVFWLLDNHLSKRRSYLENQAD